jgi:hypothetical protein
MKLMKGAKREPSSPEEGTGANVVIDFNTTKPQGRGRDHEVEAKNK